MTTKTRNSILDALELHAIERPHANAYTFLGDGVTETEQVSFEQLRHQVHRVASIVSEAAKPGSRALLIYPPGIDFIRAFLGCLVAGIVPVPVHVPRSNRHVDRLIGIARDSEPELLLATTGFRDDVQNLFGTDHELATRRWLSTDISEGTQSSVLTARKMVGDEIAFLQYTSGSTTSPKGVVVSHANVASNQELIQRAFGTTHESVVVSWLPHYHDMGLIGGILHPLWAGARCILMPPTAFLRNPALWLRAISTYRGSVSGGPNFAFELCAEKIGNSAKAQLELSSWKVAFNGAEAIRTSTLARFVSSFEQVGFSATSITPCYGLAEATLFVSSKRQTTPVSTFQPPPALGKSQFRAEPIALADAPGIVSCGEVGTDIELRIVHPETGELLPDHSIGEILVAGPSVAKGYWKNPDATEATFGGTIPGSPQRFLRTGDLGFLADGELVVTGRIKDLIIINGRNHHAEDVEATAAGCHPALAICPSAAFSVSNANTSESAALVQELPRHVDALGSLHELAEIIHASVAEEREVLLEAVVLVRAGSIPRTTSGKVKRQACREHYLTGTLDVRYEFRPGQTVERNAALAAVSLENTEDELEQQIKLTAARLLNCRPDQIDSSRSLLSLGFDSLLTVTLQAELETALGLRLPLDLMLGTMSLADLALQLVKEATPGAPRVVHAPELAGLYPLSQGQKALYYIQLLGPDSPAYNLFSASRSRVSLDISRLREALAILVDRHPMLRSIFVQDSGMLMRSVIGTGELRNFQSVDASGWTEEELRGYLQKRCNLPFDLASYPPLRVEVLQQAGRGDVLLIVTHHIVADLWSAAMFLEELASLYNAAPDQRHSVLAPIGEFSYFSAVGREELLLSVGGDGERQREYWTRYLAGAPTLLNLPFDHSPEQQRHRGKNLWFELDEGLSEQVKATAAGEDVSLYTFLLAAYGTLLLRISGQDDILVGSPVSGRTAVGDSQTIGYFVNQVVIRAQWEHDLPFSAFLKRIQEDVGKALSNQSFPFSALVDSLPISRQANRPPLTQAMFGFHNTTHMLGNDLSGFALGKAGARFHRGSLELEAIEVENEGAQSELTLFMAEEGGRLIGVFQYDPDLFERNSVERFAGELLVLIRAVVEDSAKTLGSLPLITADEERKLVSDWNQTESKFDENASVPVAITLRAKLAPIDVAVIARDGDLTYRDLDTRATALAKALRGCEVRPNDVVALLVDRTSDLIVGMVGILKSGAAFLPIDQALPADRIEYMMTAATVRIAVANSDSFEAVLRTATVQTVIRLDALGKLGASDSQEVAEEICAGNPRDLAYVIFTSGSTGKPKGVMVSKRNLANFFHAMSEEIDCGPGDRFYALTSSSFDISLLELLWPLTKGAEVCLIPEQRHRGDRLLGTWREAPARMEFSLFYFADAPHQDRKAAYDLLLQGAQYADRNGFAAVWTPERHFHSFGGLYPNPAVTGAALAVLTKNVRIRAGSVVLPLHSPIRVAEEWAVVDNLSGGRTDIAFASGWHANDFAIAPKNFRDRREIMLAAIDTVRQLWSGKSVLVENGTGDEISVELFPKPVQAELSMWVTASGTPATFEVAGATGANVLTHLLGQTVDDIARNITVYREARKRAGYVDAEGHVTLMLHTYLAESPEEVEKVVREPFKQYLRSSVGLIEKFIRTMDLPADLNQLTDEDMNALLDFAADRYFRTSALFGTVDTCEPFIEQLIKIGVNEVACLIDFGIEPNLTLTGLEQIRALKKRFDSSEAVVKSGHGRRRSFLQCTPSMVKMLLAEDAPDSPLHSLDTLLIGGEPLPEPLVAKLRAKYSCKIVNMYGPTETTIWSTLQRLDEPLAPMKVGKPLANTQCYILDRRRMLVPAGVVGELYIGGDGVARGYIGRQDLTEERFLPDPLRADPEARLYRTGDLARYDADGRIEVIGRADLQVKVRGHRVELGEIETALNSHPDVQDAVVVTKTLGEGDRELVAYVVPGRNATLSDHDIRKFVSKTLPSYMVPTHIIQIQSLPLLTSGKADRRSLEARPLANQELSENLSATPPASAVFDARLEGEILALWKAVLNRDHISADENFFDLGGNSLMMVQVHTALSKKIGRHFALLTMLENPTVRSLSRALMGDSTTPKHFQIESRDDDRAALQRKALVALRKPAAATEVLQK